MSLTAAQKTNVRRWAGYAATADALIDDSHDDAFVITLGVRTTLEHRLNTLTAAEESVLTTFYLTQLATLEAAIPAMTGSLDTDSAGSWQANPRELDQRIRLFNRVRRDMCAYIGVDPGPSLGLGGMILRG